jgi:sortase A
MTRIHPAVGVAALVPIVLIVLGAVQWSTYLQANDVPSQAAEETALPVAVRIPRLGVSAPVRDVGLTPEGGMDIPDDAFTVGWYVAAAAPGQQGNAVFAGHRDTVTGTPGVFWRLNELNEGDEIIVEMNDGTEKTFAVERSVAYPYNNAPMEEIFGRSDKRSLNLVTCAGSWNRDTYDHRLVVYSVYKNGTE